MDVKRDRFHQTVQMEVDGLPRRQHPLPSPLPPRPRGKLDLGNPKLNLGRDKGRDNSEPLRVTLGFSDAGLPLPSITPCCYRVRPMSASSQDIRTSPRGRVLRSRSALRQAEGDECHDVPRPTSISRPLQNVVMSLPPPLAQPLLAYSRNVSPDRVDDARRLSRSLLLLDVRLSDDVPSRPLGELDLESLKVVGLLRVSGVWRRSEKDSGETAGWWKDWEWSEWSPLAARRQSVRESIAHLSRLPGSELLGPSGRLPLLSHTGLLDGLLDRS